MIERAAGTLGLLPAYLTQEKRSEGALGHHCLASVRRKNDRPAFARNQPAHRKILGNALGKVLETADLVERLPAHGTHGAENEIDATQANVDQDRGYHPVVDIQGAEVCDRPLHRKPLVETGDGADSSVGKRRRHGGDAVAVNTYVAVGE